MVQSYYKIIFLIMWFGGTVMASRIQEWEDFPGGEPKPFVPGKFYSNYNTVRTVFIL